jgi:hypothetical protein
MDTFAGLIGGWDNLIIGLVGVRFAMLIGAVAQLGIALLGTIPAIVAFNLAVIANPIGGVLVLVGLLAGLVYVVHRNWAPLTEFFTELWAGIKSAFGDAVDWIAQKIAMFTALVTNFIVKLNALQPEWMKRFTLPGAALNALAGAVAPAVAPQTVPSAIGPGGAQASAAGAAGRGPGAERINIGGILKIEIDQHGRARVAELKSENSDALDLEVYSGQMMMTP